MTNLRVLGLMSGTSMDGVDVALVETDGEDRIVFGPHASFPYSVEDRAALRTSLAEARDLDRREARPGAVGRAEAIVTERHGTAVEAFLEAHGLRADEIDVVGFHGHTVVHRPDYGLTVQIGDGPALADRLGIPVAWDFRAADVAGGGQGAPLVPVYHQALVALAGLEGAVAIVNIGGVANVSLIMPGRDPHACDCGPGNALLDDLVLERTGQAFDHDGALSSAGRVDSGVLADLMRHPFFSKAAPKSLDRNAFSLAPVAHLATSDAAATLAAFTAAAIASTIDGLPVQPEHAIVCGGGGHNPQIMRELRERLSCRLSSADDMGWSTDAMEAQAFAYLAVRQTKALPITFPATTGIATPITGGRLSRPSGS